MPEDAPRAPSSKEDAFAATIAPSSDARGLDAPTPPHKLPATSSNISSDATVAAPVTGSLPPLPEVSSKLYKTDREIARGGMGRIVAAEDCRLGRPVALKELLDPGGDQNTRFQREALITARLQHPGIVPVYEAGRWPTGEPFFAMKLVSGRPLDKVIADAPTLDDRLALLPRLAAACDAIAYAHSQRIIHRDLKPGNVLIGDFGETVVIDWGLAKDLDAADGPDSANRPPRPSAAEIAKPATSSASSGSGGSTAGTGARPSAPPKGGAVASTLTIAGAVMGTPAYMAPEQARGEPVDQRADVFALGAMLYHLMAGVPPYNARTATDVIAAAALGKVVPLRDREKRAPHELVAIVERAMAPLQLDRYPQAGQLADELRRFMTGQLVGAHRYTAVQRIGRFVRRHRAAVTISAIAVAGFAVGGTMAVTRIVNARDQARREERVATTRKLAGERLIDYMFTHVRTQLTAIGRLDLMAGLGSEVRRYYDKLSRIPGGMPPEDQIRMVEAIELIGQAEHTSGKPDQALATWKEARDKIAAVVGHDRGPQTFRLRRLLAKLDHESGEIFQERGKVDDAIKLFASAKHEYDSLHDEDPSARDLLLGAADTHDRLGDLLRTEGKIDEAFEEYSEAKSQRERAASQGNGQVSQEQMALSTSHLKLGSIYQNRGESSIALDEYKTALRLRESMLASQPDNVEIEERVLDVQDQLADLERMTGDEASAVETYRRALPITQSMMQRDPTNTDWQRQRANIFAGLGYALIESGEYKDAIAQLDSAIAVQKDLVVRDPKSTRYRVELSRSYTRAGDAELDLGHVDDGLAHYKLALEIRRELVDKDAKSVPFRRSLGWSYAKLAAAYAAQGDAPRAIDAHEQALAIREPLVGEAPAQGGFKDELAASEVDLGRLLLARDAKRAGELIDRAVKRARALVDGDPINTDWKETLVRGLLAQGAATTDRKAQGAMLAEALQLAEDVVTRAPQNAVWPGYVAEAHIALAELATAKAEHKTAATEWSRAQQMLEPLAKSGRLAASRLPLLDRARAHR